MSEIKNGELGLYCAKHFKCNNMMTLGFRGLSCLFSWFQVLIDYTNGMQPEDAGPCCVIRGL